MYIVIGVYEVYDCHSVPTHILPIVVEKTQQGYRRWCYSVQVQPYRICLQTPIGDLHNTLNSIFPYPSYLLISPIPFSSRSQYVLLGDNKVVCSRYKLVLMGRLLMQLLYPVPTKGRIVRTLQTIRNVYQESVT
jgi:hypothetical protein